MAEQSVQEIAKHLAEIIKVAASSNLGIVALMVILFSGLAYGFFRKSKEIWRLAALILLFVGCISFGYVIFSTAKQSSVTLLTRSQIDLSKLAEKWVQEAESARAAKTIFPGAPLPPSLVEARNLFESAWKNSSLAEKKALNVDQDSVDARAPDKGLAPSGHMAQPRIRCFIKAKAATIRFLSMWMSCGSGMTSSTLG